VTHRSPLAYDVSKLSAVMFAWEVEARAEAAYLDGVVCLDLLVFEGVLLCDISSFGCIARRGWDSDCQEWKCNRSSMSSSQVDG
jgi:hypothetical protein